MKKLKNKQIECQKLFSFQQKTKKQTLVSWLISCLFVFVVKILEVFDKKIPRKHNFCDWFRVIASNKDRNVYELRYFNIPENGGEDED